MAKTTARSRGWGTRAGNPLSEADGPPRRTVRPAGTSGPASGPTCTRLPSPPPTRRPLPKEGSHRQPKDTAASRGPAPERAPPGCGRRRKREGGREARDRKRDASGRGASPAKPRGRVRLEDAPRRGGGARRGEEERDRGKERRRPARAPGAASLPRRGGRPRPFPDDTRSKTQRREPHAPPGHPRSHHFSLRLYAHRAAAASTEAAAAAAAATEPRPRALGLRDTPPPNAHGSFPLSPTWIPADRPAEARPRAGHVPHPSTTPDPHREFPTGQRPGEREEARRGEEGAPTRAARERERRSGGERSKRTRGKGRRSGERGTPRTGRGRRTTATDDDAHTRLDLGRRRARTGVCVGPCEQTPSRATPPLGERGRRLIVKRRSDRRSPGRNPGPQVRSKCR